MFTVLGCIENDHNIWLVLVAALVCALGSWNVLGLFDRASGTSGLQRAGWLFLTALASGAAIWCTHFIAMLAYEPGVPVGFDPVLTIISLLIAVGGAGFGFFVATSGSGRSAPGIGGGVVGLSVAVMHYAGMAAYRPQGIISWNPTFLTASVLLCVMLAAAAIHIALRAVHPSRKMLAASVLVLAIVTLHFTGMAAFSVVPMTIDGSYSNPAAMQALAVVVAGVALLVVGAGFASWVIDKSARGESVERLRYMAMNDNLTGLPNRASFNDRLASSLTEADAAGSRVALVGIDLNRFKEINDVRGHAAGDKVLEALAARMQGLLQDGEFVARLGGDEFAAIQPMRDQAGLLDFLDRIESALSTPIQIDDFEIIPGASLGVAVYPENADDLQSLIGNADLAMYRAKADITSAVCFYDQVMDETVRARRHLASDLREALENRELDIHYQVQTSISTGQITGYEALLRWRHPRLGNISPAEFIPLAEESGLILKLGAWVLTEACLRAASWEPPYKVAINLSPVQFAHSDLPKLVVEALLASGLSPSQLELELTETTIFADRDRSLHMLRQIRALGVSIALDDFGTGYSSLDTLRSFPFDKIKLDRSFMSEVESSPQAKAIIRAVLALGKSLSIPVLAEGIETAGQLELLRLEGCDEAQGFLLGRPAPLQQLLDEGHIVAKPGGNLSGGEPKAFKSGPRARRLG
ncbi:diguanylate cyclase/phosphodiesterase [Hoeflea marina]|uniref:Diguanylate cyclase/phosphodiesterase n=1 Tax=Hoeflea marina TaxID=274592 RepID=A0A317PR34_9HYPH|nr:bifunctional diguanylate cyclase/phosphodiesterase [Hoeflea marina]PWW03943.1 diguanylate cyclase/phosphodiesterase [Hoeflea marina]